MSKQEECNKCKTAGFPNQIIGFKKSTRMNTASGKPFWDLINPDGSEHVHKQNGLETIHLWHNWVHIDSHCLAFLFPLIVIA